ncbi:MAG: LysR family transcriptional regulator [Desulfovibrio sp.]|jgi:molybdate transport system regulatory protein|nr:LysR family transcriptional regulator [Desulfovibrio sp.]
MGLSIKLFVEKDGKYILGTGRIGLLKSIPQLGSLRQAAQQLGMSYRWAWGRLNTAETELGIPLLSRNVNTGKNRSMSLTPEGEAIVKWFEETEREVNECLARMEKQMPEPLKKALAKDSGADGG